MTDYGLTSHGFVRKTLDEIKADINNRILADIDPTMDVTSSSPIGQIVGIFADKLAQAWELLEAVYASQYPDSATRMSLTRVAAITGTEREGATKSQVELTLNVDGGVTLPAGQIVAVDGNPDARFVTTTELVTPVGPADDYVLTGEGEEAGPIAANAGTITVIVTPVTGWNSVTNVAAADPGALEEEDVDLRIRRQDELRAQGTTPLDAIRADMLEEDAAADWPGVDQCTVFQNVMDATDADGLPPHSVEVVVSDNDVTITDDIIRARIFSLVAAGIRAFGTLAGLVTDTFGYDHTVAFTRAEEVLVWIEVDVTIDPQLYPADGDDQIVTAVNAVGLDYRIGGDVVARRFVAAAYTVAGVVDVPAVRLGFADNPVGTSNLAIGRREIAVITDVVVASTDAVDL